MRLAWESCATTAQSAKVPLLDRGVGVGGARPYTATSEEFDDLLTSGFPPPKTAGITILELHATEPLL